MRALPPTRQMQGGAEVTFKLLYLLMLNWEDIPISTLILNNLWMILTKCALAKRLCFRKLITRSPVGGKYLSEIIKNPIHLSYWKFPILSTQGLMITFLILHKHP